MFFLLFSHFRFDRFISFFCSGKCCNKHSKCYDRINNTHAGPALLAVSKEMYQRNRNHIDYQLCDHCKFKPDCIHYISVMLLGCYQRKHSIVRKIWCSKTNCCKENIYKQHINCFSVCSDIRNCKNHNQTDNKRRCTP